MLNMHWTHPLYQPTFSDYDDDDDDNDSDDNNVDNDDGEKNDDDYDEDVVDYDDNSDYVNYDQWWFVRKRIHVKRKRRFHYLKCQRLMFRSQE